jgi:hypothetical protein
VLKLFNSFPLLFSARHLWRPAARGASRGTPRRRRRRPRDCEPFWERGQPYDGLPHISDDAARAGIAAVLVGGEALGHEVSPVQCATLAAVLVALVHQARVVGGFSSVKVARCQTCVLFFFSPCILRYYLSKPLTSLSCPLNAVFPGFKMRDTFAFDCLLTYKVRPGTGVQPQSLNRLLAAAIFLSNYTVQLQCLQCAPGHRVTEKSNFSTLNVGLGGNSPMSKWLALR